MKFKRRTNISFHIKAKRILFSCNYEKLFSEDFVRMISSENH